MSKAEQFISMVDEQGRAINPQAIRQSMAKVKASLRYIMPQPHEQQLQNGIALRGEIDGIPIKITIEPHYRTF